MDDGFAVCIILSMRMNWDVNRMSTAINSMVLKIVKYHLGNGTLWKWVVFIILGAL